MDNGDLRALMVRVKEIRRLGRLHAKAGLALAESIVGLCKEINRLRDENSQNPPPLPGEQN